MLKRFVPLALLACALAAAPAPAPTLAPPAVALPSAAPVYSGQAPVILIFPFDVQTGADSKLGNAIAQILAQEMVAAGGVTVRAIPLGVKRVNFLDTARAAKADFYISGYVTAVGESAAVVEQVVSVESGVILFSQTAQVSSVADVASQSLLARSQILAFVGRGTQTVETQNSSTPPPTQTNGAQMPVSGIASIVDSVFKHKVSRAPGPVAVAKPSRGMIVAPVTASGHVVPAELTGAWHDLYFALDKHYAVQTTGITSAVAQSTDAICGANRDNTIATGTLQEIPAGRNRVAVTFELAVYTCFGATLGRETGKGTSLKAAVDAAVNAYAAAHPHND